MAPGASCLADVFVRAVEQFPDRTCMHRRIGTESIRISYAEMAGRVATILDVFEGLGIRSGQRIACYLDDVADSVHMAVACAHAGVTTVPLDPRSSPTALRRLNERTEAVAVFTRPEHLAQLGELAIPTLVFVEGAAPAGTINLHRDTNPDARTALELLRTLRPPASTLYVIQPTSGTTGEPKLMLRTQLPFLRIARLWRFQQLDAVATPQRRIMVNPLTHGTGLLDLWSGFAIGAEMCVPSRPNTEAPLDEVRALDPHVLVMVPRILRALHRTQVSRGEPPGTRLLGPSAKIFVFGGAPCEPELQTLLLEQGVQVLEVYGTSETGILTMMPIGERRVGWAGKPFDDVEIKIDEDGEILARSQCMMEGYLGDETLTRESYDDEGFYRTGDFGELSADGWVKILGRKKDVFNTPLGNNIFPGRLEGMLEQVPAVQQAVLIGDSRLFLTALVVLGKGDRLDEVARHVKEMNRRLEPEERVRRLCALDAPFDGDLYRPVGHGKVRRERKLIEERYKPLIDALYQERSESPAICVVE